MILTMKIPHHVIKLRSSFRGSLSCARNQRKILAVSPAASKSGARSLSQISEAVVANPLVVEVKEKELGVVQKSLKDFEWKTPEFDNSSVIYRNKNGGELLRAYTIFTMCSFDILVDNQVKLLRWSRRLLGSRCFTWLLKRTLFAQFMVGTSKDELMTLARRHSLSGIHPMFAYTASEVHGNTTKSDPATNDSGISHKESWFISNVNEISRSILIAAECKDLAATTPLVSTKLTFMAQAELLESFSRIIVEQSGALQQILLNESRGRQFKDDANGFFLEMIEESKAFGELPSVQVPKDDIVRHLTSLLTNTSFQIVVNQKSAKLESFQNGKKIPTLSADELNGIICVWQKMKKLNELTVSCGIQLNYDAEQTYLQPAIESLALDSMRQSNRSTPHILNTYQCYLKRTHGVIERDLEMCRREGFCFGGKLVRGAYVDEETRLSKERGYENPVNDSYDATTGMYLRVMNTALDHCNSLLPGQTRLVFATHNKDTVKSVIDGLNSRGMHPAQYGVSFAQLLGMRDFISFALGEAGYPAGKLIHYADPESGVAYLSRRLLENRSGLPSPLIERSLLLAEIKRRATPRAFRRV